MTDAEALFQLSRFVRHRPWCPEFNGPGDCTCGLYALLDSIRCTTCDHKVSVHTNRDVSDVVGWPCSECKSERCTGFAHSCYDPETMAAALHGHRHAHQCLPADGLDAAWDACVTEIREASRTLSDLYVAAPKDAQRQVAALDRIHLAIAAFAALRERRG